MMLPGSRKYILPPATRICAEAWKDWQTSFASVFIWIPMTEIRCFCSVANEQTVSRDSCGREMDSCYYTNGWTTVLLTGRETTKKHCRSLQISTHAHAGTGDRCQTPYRADRGPEETFLSFVHFVEIFGLSSQGKVVLSRGVPDRLYLQRKT